MCKFVQDGRYTDACKAIRAQAKDAAIAAADAGLQFTAVMFVCGMLHSAQGSHAVAR